MNRGARQAAGEDELPDALHQWARRYDLPTYASRVDELLRELA